jgi:phosphate-selective porin OprO/OprP
MDGGALADGAISLKRQGCRMNGRKLAWILIALPAVFLSAHCSPLVAQDQPSSFVGDLRGPAGAGGGVPNGWRAETFHPRSGYVQSATTAAAPVAAYGVPGPMHGGANRPVAASPIPRQHPPAQTARLAYAQASQPAPQGAIGADEPAEQPRGFEEINPSAAPDASMNQQQQAPRGATSADLPSEQPSGFEDLGQRVAALEKTKGTLPSVRLTGVSQLDVGDFSQDANSKQVLDDIENGVGFRRTRLQALGKLSEFTSYSIEVDFAAAGRPSFMDVWVEQAELPFFGNVRLGQYRQPMTLESATSFRHLEFIEYSTVFSAFDPFRRVGVMSWFNSDDERTLIQYSLYSTGSTFYNGNNPFDGTTVYNSLGGDNRFGTTLSDNGASFTIRGTHLFYYDEPTEGRYLFHAGLNYNYSEIGGHGLTGPGVRTYQARTIPEFFVGDPAGGGVTAAGTPFVMDTGRFRANNFSIYHAEVAGNYGPSHFQAEYLATTVSQPDGPLVFLDGAYVQCGYFLTGENVGYNKQMGALDYNVKPYTDFFGLGRHRTFGGWGAWEVAFRWSVVDLRGSKINPANIVPNPPGVPPSPAAAVPDGTNTVPAFGGPNPGILNQSTVALNWWWNQYTRLQFNWIHSMAQSTNFGFNAMDIFAGRVQLEF